MVNPTLNINSFFKILIRYRKVIALFSSSLIIVISQILIGFLWCVTVNQPINKLIVYDLRYLPIVFTYAKTTLYYVGYLWALYLFVSLFYYEIIGFSKLLKVFIIHSSIIAAVGISAMIPSYMVFKRMIEPSNFFVYYYLPSTMLILEIYMVIALIHSLYYMIRKLTPYTGRLKSLGITILVYLFGFITSIIIGSTIIFVPVMYNPVIECKAPVFELEQWTRYIVPSVIFLVDSYVSPIVRYMFIVFFIEKLKR